MVAVGFFPKISLVEGYGISNKTAVFMVSHIQLENPRVHSEDMVAGFVDFSDIPLACTSMEAVHDCIQFRLFLDCFWKHSCQ